MHGTRGELIGDHTIAPLEKIFQNTTDLHWSETSTGITKGSQNLLNNLYCKAVSFCPCLSHQYLIFLLPLLPRFCAKLTHTRNPLWKFLDQPKRETVLAALLQQRCYRQGVKCNLCDLRYSSLSQSILLITVNSLLATTSRKRAPPISEHLVNNRFVSQWNTVSKTLGKGGACTPWKNISAHPRTIIFILSLLQSQQFLSLYHANFATATDTSLCLNLKWQLFCPYWRLRSWHALQL